MTAHNWFALCLSTLIAVCSAGCVRRTVSINSDPQGARVFLNDDEVGTSPVSVDFLWYGDYDVILRKPGYQALKTHYRIDPPWYQLPGIDFISEVLVPVEIHDQREATFTMTPAATPETETLINQAQTFRDQALYTQD